MNKYDKMLELNKKKSEEKVTSAVNTIREMVVEKEKVSIPRRCGISGDPSSPTGSGEIQRQRDPLE